MALFVWEARKLMVKRRGLLILALFLALRLGGLLLLDTPAKEDLEAYREDYTYYLSQVEGPLTQDSIALLEEVSQRMREADRALPNLYGSYYDGAISAAELAAEAAPLEALQSRKQGFNLLYEQLIYAREDPARRYLLYDNGWNALLTQDSLDPAFVGLLLLTLTPILCHEYHSGMDVLSLTTVRGARRATLAKLLLGLAVITLLCLLQGGLSYGFYSLRYGLPHGAYPLQSLPYFATSSKSLTLWQAFLCVTAGRWLGSLLFGGIILCLSALTHTYALTLTLSTALLALPYYAAPSASARYALPGPLPFLLGAGLLRGTETAVDPLTQQEVVQFHEISGGGLRLLVGAALLLLAVMLLVLFQTTSPPRRGRWRRNVRRGAAALLSLLLLVGSAGCAGGDPGAEGDTIYNAAHRDRFEHTRYTIWYDGETEAILFQDKETGRRERLVRDPLSLSSTIGRCVYGDGRYVYYFRNDYNKAGRYETLARVALMEVDLETLQARVVYENAGHALKDVFWGSGVNSLYDAATRQNARAPLEDVWAFFLEGKTLYLLGDTVRTLDLRTGRMGTLAGPSPTKGSLAFDGRTLYYTTDRLQVEAYDTQTGLRTLVPDLITEFFFLTDTRFIYINRADEYRLYAMDRADGTATPLTDEPVLWFEVDGASIYYTGRFDGRTYRMEGDGSGRIPVEGYAGI